MNNARELVGIDAYESRHRLVFSQRGGQEPSSFTIVTRRGLRPRRTQRRHDFVLVFPGRPSTSCHYYVFSVRVISLGAAGIYRVSTEHQEIAAESPPFPRFLFFLSFFSSSFFRFLRCTAVMTLAYPVTSLQFSQLVSFHQVRTGEGNARSFLGSLYVMIRHPDEIFDIS